MDHDLARGLRFGLQMSAALWALIFLCVHLAFAQTVAPAPRTYGPGVPTTMFVGTTAGGPTAYTAATTAPTGFTATAYYQFCGQFTTTNTGAATLNVGSTSAIPINILTSTGPAALAGGEIVSGNYCFQLNSAADAWIMQTSTGSGVTQLTTASANHNVTQAEWANGQAFVISAASQTITLPVVTTLASGGGILIETTPGITASLVPNSADGINGGAINTPAPIQANAFTGVTTTGSSGVNAIKAALGVTPGGAARLDTGASTGNVFTAPSGYFVCTAACTVTPPVPVAGYQFCVWDLPGTTGAITLANPGTGVMYGKVDFSGYGTATSGTLVSSGAAGDKACIVGKDATHYDTPSSHGSWTAS